MKKKENIEVLQATETKSRESPKDSPEKVAYMRLIALYKEQNPVKYESKREAFEAKLAKL